MLEIKAGGEQSNTRPNSKKERINSITALNLEFNCG
jgi:hypothetical protein